MEKENTPGRPSDLPTFVSNTGNEEFRLILLNALKKNAHTAHVKLFIHDIVVKNRLDKSSYMAFNTVGKQLQREGRLRIAFNQHLGRWYIERIGKVCVKCETVAECYLHECKRKDTLPPVAHNPPPPKTKVG